MRKLRVIVSILILSSIGIDKALPQVSIDGEFRPRFEFRDGYKKLPDSKTSFAALVSQRTRLSLNFRNELFKTKLTFQDVRYWGDEKLKDYAARTSVHEAWLELKLCDSLSLRAGRQELSYDNERLFSISSWNQQGITHDAAVLKYHSYGWKVDIGGAFNQAEDINFNAEYKLDNYKSLSYFWLTKEVKKFNFSFLGIADGFQKTGTTNTIYLRETFGPTIGFKNEKFNIAARAYYQTGYTTKGIEINPYYEYRKIPINAYFFNFDALYNINKKLAVQIGFEYLSGQNNKDMEYFSSFSTLYGTSHRFNGNMDYFTKFPTDMKYAGLNNPYIYFIYKLNDKMSLRLDINYFALQNNIYYDKTAQKSTPEHQPLTATHKYLGSEADLSFKYDISKEVSLLTGYSAMLPDNSMVNIIGGDRKHYAHWAFVMLTVKPTFFKN